MGSFSIWHWLIVLGVIVLSFGTTRFMRIDREWLQSRLHRDVGHMPVYSAETTNGKEAEFIRDRLPSRSPTIVVLVLVVIVGAVAWWLTR